MSYEQQEKAWGKTKVSWFYTRCEAMQGLTHTWPVYCRFSQVMAISSSQHIQIETTSPNYIALLLTTGEQLPAPQNKGI